MTPVLAFDSLKLPVKMSVSSNSQDKKLEAEVISWNLQISNTTFRNLFIRSCAGVHLNPRCAELSVFALSAVAAEKGEEAGALRRTHEHPGLILMHYFNSAWALHPWLTIYLHREGFTGSDSDRWTLSQSSACALQPRVDLSHFHCSFQTHHLQQLIWWVLHSKKELFGVNNCGFLFWRLFSSSTMAPPFLTLSP